LSTDIAIVQGAPSAQAAHAALDPGELASWSCQHCATKATLTIGTARGLGWRIYDGLSVTGKRLSVRLCPACVGAGEVRAGDGVPRGFDAECSTCDARMSDDWWDEEPDYGWSEKDAENWISEHECQPDTHIVRPGTRRSA